LPFSPAGCENTNNRLGTEPVKIARKIKITRYYTFIFGSNTYTGNLAESVMVIKKRQNQDIKFPISLAFAINLQSRFSDFSRNRCVIFPSSFLQLRHGYEPYLSYLKRSVSGKPHLDQQRWFRIGW
jgi:hypothetical protein